MLALGRGQRELILGDRATGKTTLATDTMIHQRDSDVVSIYVGVGQKSSSLRQVIDAVQEHGAPERTVFVIAPRLLRPGCNGSRRLPDSPSPNISATAAGHALVVIDDLTKHAATHRELSLLMRQPPGREAYPGDVFYLHARLLERAAKLSSDKGGGSITALPIAETEAGSISGYIPTNLISITDGQIVLDSKLFYEAGAGDRHRSQRQPRRRQDPADCFARARRACASNMRSSSSSSCLPASAPPSMTAREPRSLMADASVPRCSKASTHLYR